VAVAAEFDLSPAKAGGRKAKARNTEGKGEQLGRLIRRLGKCLRPTGAGLLIYHNGLPVGGSEKRAHRLIDPGKHILMLYHSHRIFKAIFMQIRDPQR